MAHKHRPYTAEELSDALEDGSVTLERLAATVHAGMMKKITSPSETGQQQNKPQYGKR